MRRLRLGLAVGIAMLPAFGLAQQISTGPYRVLKTVKVGGTGGFDYVNADVDGRRLYVARAGDMPVINVYNLDTLEHVGDISTSNSHGAVVDSKSGHGFASSKPLSMFDAKTMMPIKTIDVKGNPDGMMYDPSDRRVYVLSHVAPHVTVIDAKDASIVGTIDIGGMPEQAASDGRGRLYIDVEDKGNIAVVNTKTLMVTAHYDLAGKGGTCAGLALDVKNHILFATCREPANMVILSADDGRIITTLPIGVHSDGAGFNPNTMEAFSSQADGTLTVIKENNPSSFVVEQNLQTKENAKTMALDTKTGRIFLIAGEYVPPAVPALPGRRTVLPDTFSILMVGR